MFMEIDRLQSLVDSENVNQDLITTAEGVCKNVASHIMDGLSDKDEIQQILYVLQNIGRNVSDFNDLIISKDFQQMKAALYLKLGCETEKDEDMFMLMEQFLDAVNILSESSAEGKSTFVENWVEIYLDILLQDKSDFRHILEVLKSLNILLEDASSNVKEYLLSRNSVTDYLYQIFIQDLGKKHEYLGRIENVIKGNNIADQQLFLIKYKMSGAIKYFRKTKCSRLAAFLNQVGDYEFQVGIAECLFRIIPKKIREQVSSSIFQNQCTRKSFLQIRDNEFETDCRLFLNSLNASLKRSKRVFSLPCNKAWLGDKELYKPDDPNYDTFWIDFNAGSERLTVFCGPYNSASSQVSNEDLWETLTVWKDDVHSCNVKKIKKIKIVNILFSKTISDIYPSQQDVSGRSVRLHFDINCCVEEALNMTFGTEMTGPKVSTVSTPLVYKKGEVQQEEDGETLPCTPVSSLCRRKASVPEMHMLGMQSPALSISSKVSEPISAVRINFSKMPSDPVPKDTSKAFQTPKVPAMKSKTKVKTPVVTVTPPSKSKKKTPTKTSSTKLNNDTSNVMITSTSKTKKHIDADLLEKKTSLADPLVQLDNTDMDSIPDSYPDVIYLKDSNKIDSGTTCKKSKAKDKDTMQSLDLNPLPLSSNKTKKGKSKNEKAVKSGNTKTIESKPKRSSDPDMGKDVTNTQNTAEMPSNCSVDNPVQMETKGAKHENTEKPLRETVDSCGNLHSNSVTMSNNAKDNNNTSVGKDEFQVLDYFPKPMKTFSVNRKRNVETENEDGLLENHYNRKQQEITNNKQEQIKKNEMIDNKVKNKSTFDFTGDDESFKDEKTNKKQLKKQIQEKIKVPTVQLQEGVYEQNEVLKTTYKDENYVEKEYAEETLVMGKSTKDRGCKVINKTELKYLKKNEKFEQTTATGKGKKGKKNDNTKSIKRSTDSDNTGDESNIKSNKYYDYDELQPLVVEEKTQPSCDEKTLKLCSNNKLVPHKNKQGNKRGNFDKYATCEVELNVVDCELNGVEENKKQADTCYKFSGKKMPYVIQMEENTNYEDTDVTIPCSLTIEDGETNIGTETNKYLVQGKCVKKQTTSEKCSKQRQRSKYKNENKQGNKKVNKLEESNVSEIMDQFSTENNARSKLVGKRTSSEQKKISGKIPQKLSHTNKKREKEMVETHDNDQVVLTLVCEEKQSNQTKTTKEDLMTKKTKKCQKLDPIVIDEDDELIFKEKSDFDSEDYCPVTMDDNDITKPRSWFKSGKNRKASDEKQFHLHETKTSQSEEKSFQGNKKKIHTKSKSQKRIENNKNVFDFTVHELCSQNDDLEKRDEADKATTNIVKEMPTFSKCGDITAVNLEDAIVDNIIQSTFDNSQGIEKSPPFTETKGVGMSKIGKYSLRKRNKEKLREAYKTSEDTDDEVTSINSSNEKLVNERLHLSPSDKFVQRSKLDKSKANEQLYGRKQKESNEGKNTCAVMQNKKFFHSYSSSKLNNDKSENVTSRTFKKMDSSTCFGFNSPLNKVQQSHSSKKSVLLFMSYSQSGTILPCEKGDATSDPYDFDAECNIQKTTIRTNNQSKEKRSHFTAKDDLYKTNKCKDKDDAYMTVQRKNKTNTNNYFDSQSSDNIPVFNYENDKGKKKKQRTSNMTKKYFARSPNFSDENCANQNSFDFLKKTVVGSKTCVQRENSLQKTKSHTTYNKQKKKQKESKQKEQDNYILKLDDFSCIESPDQNIAADCSEINTEKISKYKSTSVEQNRNSTVIYQDDERDDDHSLDSQSPVKPLKKLQNKKNMKKRKNKDIYSDEDFNHIEDEMECAHKPTNFILDNFSSVCKKIVSNYEDDVIYNSKEDNLPVRNTKKSKMLSTPNLPITSFMKTPTTPGTAKRLYKSLDISFIKTPKTPVSEYNDDNYIDISEGLSQKSLLMNHESDVDNNEVKEQENSLSLEKDRNQRSMDLIDKKRKRRQDTIEDKHVDDVVCSPCSTINKILSRSLASFVDMEEDTLMSPVNIDENPVCGPLDKISFTDDTVKNFMRQEKLHRSGFVSGPSTTVRPSKSSLKRKYSDVIDSEEEDMELDIVDVPDKFYRPRKLFKEQRYFVEEHSFTNETVSDGSSVAFSEIAATTEVSTLLKAFGLDVQRHVKEKSQNLEFLTKAALKSSQKKIDSVWMKQQHKRSSVLEKYQCNMLQELLALEKDVSLLEKAEDNAMTFYKQQMSYLQKFRMTQDKRLSNLNDLQQGLQEEMSEIENQSSNQYAVVKAKMKENMTCMQKKLLLESQKDELNQVKRNLQTIFF